jgi:DNA-binding protein HU-beta
MNKADLIEKLSDEVGFTKKDTGIFLDGFIKTVQESIKNGENIQLIGFGAFELKERSARKGRNPRNGEPIEIPATKVPTFKAGKTFKDMVNE